MSLMDCLINASRRVTGITTRDLIRINSSSLRENSCLLAKYLAQLTLSFLSDQFLEIAIDKFCNSVSCNVSVKTCSLKTGVPETIRHTEELLCSSGRILSSTEI